MSYAVFLRTPGRSHTHGWYGDDQDSVDLSTLTKSTASWPAASLLSVARKLAESDTDTLRGTSLE